MVILNRAIIVIGALLISSSVLSNQVLVKDLIRIKGARVNSIVGYGLVTGLAGTGDSARSEATIQSLSNVMKRFGVQVSPKEMRSRNVAAVTLTAKLPVYAQEGDVLDVNVSSIGDARSLVGGTLLMTELRGPDQQIYAVAQGPLTVGGYSHSMNGSSIQKNHPTSAVVSNGAIIERDVVSDLFLDDRATLILRNPDIKTSFTISKIINNEISGVKATPENAANIKLEFYSQSNSGRLRSLMEIEDLLVTPNSTAKVVINERTGTVVYGGDVKISAISITHGEIKITIDTDTKVFSPMINISGDSSEKVSDSSIQVEEKSANQATLEQGSSVGDLLAALKKMNATSQDVISILQAIKSAGALHAEVIVK